MLQHLLHGPFLMKQMRGRAYLSPSPRVTCLSDAAPARLQLSKFLAPSISHDAAQDCSPVKGLPVFCFYKVYVWHCGSENR